jgi:non-heme chloroperoxidase
MSTVSKEPQAERVETVAEFEKRQVERANSLHEQPVVAHGLWLLPSSLNRWSEMFEAEIIGELRITPAVIGHSFGGLLAQMIAGRELSVATVAVDPAPKALAFVRRVVG